MIKLNRYLIVECLIELSDEKRQRELWQSSEHPEVSSFTEAVCGLFDDSVLGHALDSGGTEFGATIDAKFRDLEHALSTIKDNHAPAMLIADPKMKEIRGLAYEILTMINSQEDRG